MKDALSRPYRQKETRPEDSTPIGQEVQGQASPARLCFRFEAQMPLTLNVRQTASLSIPPRRPRRRFQCPQEAEIIIRNERTYRLAVRPIRDDMLIAVD